MCNASGIAFGERVLTSEVVAGRDVLEVGAFDVNGSLRPHAESLRPGSYVGVDISPGPRVDRVLDARDLIAVFGREAFDLVISTEMVEHVRDWRTVISNMKGVLRPGGHVLITTRSAGFPYHGWPDDYWRYEPEDVRSIFADLEILAVEPDPKAPGVFVFARRPEAFSEATPDLELLSIVSGRRQRQVTDAQVAWFRATSRIRSLFAIRRARAQFYRRVIRPTWLALPGGLRSGIKRGLGRG
jgi:SAM-dependent methyltransferase